MLELQTKLDECYALYFSGDISKDDYLSKVEQLEAANKDLVKKEFGYRKDVRSLKEFAGHLVAQMDLERSIIDYWVPKWGKQSMGTDKFVYSGVEQSGRLVCRSSSTKGEFKEPDLKFLTDPHSYLEIKQCPVLHKATYKLDDLKHYNSLGNVAILTSHSVGTFSKDNIKFFTLLKSGDLSRLMDDVETGKVGAEKRREMGYKMAVQFTREGLEEYFEVHSS
jgi:hypothetical protein